MSRRSEEGIALIAVVWALLLLSLIAAALSRETRADARIARNVMDIAAARAAANAGIQRAILDLRALGRKNTFRADGTVYDWHFANCDVRISLRNEGDKVNLNQASEAALATLFASVGVDPDKAQSLADAIADFRDGDDLKHLHGAEQVDYQTAGLAWGPKNADFDAVEELQQVLGMTAAIYARVAPDVTTYGQPYAKPPLLPAKLIPLLIAHHHPFPYPRIAYSIRAEAKDAGGGIYIREAVAQLDLDANLLSIVSWRRGAASAASERGQK
jgi:general secretion pathway protein K